jgi:hypothetical protein
VVVAEPRAADQTCAGLPQLAKALATDGLIVTNDIPLRAKPGKIIIQHPFF